VKSRDGFPDGNNAATFFIDEWWGGGDVPPALSIRAAVFRLEKNSAEINRVLTSIARQEENLLSCCNKNDSAKRLIRNALKLCRGDDLAHGYE